MKIDIAVIGGGVVGLSCALKLAESGASVCMVERETRPGRGMSTHNSGVIHAGIYYPAGSLKARLCIEGRPRLYEFCERYHVAHQRCGKLLVAADDTRNFRASKRCAREVYQTARLRSRWSTSDFVRRKEPHVHAVAAIWSPDTGIVEAEALIRALARLCRDMTSRCSWAPQSSDACCINGGIEIVTPHERFVARTVINAAGLYADDVSAMLGGTRFQIKPCRGEYAELAPAKRGLGQRSRVSAATR